MRATAIEATLNTGIRRLAHPVDAEPLEEARERTDWKHSSNHTGHPRVQAPHPGVFAAVETPSCHNTGADSHACHCDGAHAGACE